MRFNFIFFQDHPVWSNHQFWEAAFYQDVQKDIRDLYYPPSASNDKDLLYSSARRSEAEVPFESNRVAFVLTPEPSALDIAAERLRVWPSLPSHKQKELNEQEESTLYSQAIHFVYRIVYLRIPLEITASSNKRSVPGNLTLYGPNSFFRRFSGHNLR